jgi:hypothetical protein
VSGWENATTSLQDARAVNLPHMAERYHRRQPSRYHGSGMTTSPPGEGRGVALPEASVTVRLEREGESMTREERSLLKMIASWVAEQESKAAEEHDTTSNLAIEIWRILKTMN